MRRRIGWIALTASVAVTAWVVSPTFTRPADAECGIRFASTQVDLGRIEGLGIIRQDFDFRVTGREEVEIVELRPSCGCLRPTLSKRIYRPGDSGRITLDIHAASAKPGPHRYQLGVTLRDPSERAVSLTVDLDLVSHVEVRPAALRISLGGSKPIRQTITITDDRPRPLDIIRLVASSTRIKPRLAPSATGASDPHVQLVELEIAADFPVGLCHERLLLVTDDPKYPSVEIPIEVERLPRMRVTPRSLRFSTNAIATDAVSRRLYVRDKNSQPVLISDVVAETSHLSFDWPKEPSRRAFVDVRLESSADATPATFDLRVRIAEPVLTELVIPIEID